MTTLTLSDLYERYAKDESFSALRTNANFVPGMGPTDIHPDLMLVGEAPGSFENAKGLPFQGSAGQVLSNLLNKVGISTGSDDIHVTNVVKYWPQKPAGMTRKPSTGEVAASKPYLLEEIDIVQPRIIGLMGYSPITTVFPSIQTVYEVNGKLMKLGDYKFVPLYHPATARHTSFKTAQVEEGFEALARYLKYVDVR